MAYWGNGWRPGRVRFCVLVGVGVAGDPGEGKLLVVAKWRWRQLVPEWETWLKARLLVARVEANQAARNVGVVPRRAPPIVSYASVKGYGAFCGCAVGAPSAE